MRRHFNQQVHSSERINFLFDQFNERINEKFSFCFGIHRHRQAALRRVHDYCDKHGFILNQSTISVIKRSLANMITTAFDHDIQSTDIQLQLTHINALPSRTERGLFIIIELGNLVEDVRYSIVLLLGKQTPSYEILLSRGYNLAENVRHSDGNILLDQLAIGLKDFLEQIPSDKPIPAILQLGLLVHFPIRQNNLDHAELRSWSGRFNCPDLIDRDLVTLFRTSIERYASDYHIIIVACIQESVAALISVAFEHPNTLIALIFERNFQVSFVDIHYSKIFLDRTIISLDFINLPSTTTSHALFQSLLTSIDIYVMRQFNVNYLEILTCDACLLETIRLVLLQLCLRGRFLPFSIWSKSKLNRIGTLHMEFLSSLMQGEHSKLKIYLNQIGLNERRMTKLNLILMEYVGHVIIRRSAQILCCLIVSLAERINEEDITIAMDSCLYRLCPSYRIYMRYEIENLCHRWIKMFNFVNATEKAYLGPAALMGLQKTQKALMNQNDEITRSYVRKKRRHLRTHHSTSSTRRSKQQQQQQHDRNLSTGKISPKNSEVISSTQYQFLSPDHHHRSLPRTLSSNL